MEIKNIHDILNQIQINAKNYVKSDDELEYEKFTASFQNKDLCDIKGISKRYYDVSLENYEVQNDNDKKLIEYLSSYDLKENILFFGNAGNGKTHLACALCKKIDGSMYINFRELYSDYVVKDDIRNSQASKNLQKCFNKKFLVLDEIDKVVSSEASNNYLYSILDKRYINVLPTLLITNLQNVGMLTTLMRTEGCDRFFENYKAFKFEKTSYRLQKNGEKNG